MEAITISRKDMNDEEYIDALETILEDMSDQTEVMFDAISLSIAALRQVKAEYECQAPGEDVAKEMYKVVDLALSMLNGEPEANEGIH